MAGEDLGRARADMPNAEASQKPRQVPPLARRKSIQQILCRLTPHPLQRFELVGRQAVEVGYAPNETTVHELIDEFFSETLDIHRVTMCPESQAFLELCRTRRIHAPQIHTPFVLDDRAVARGASRRKLELAFRSASLLGL